MLGPFGAAIAVAEERRTAVARAPSDLNHPFTPDLREMEEVGAVGGRPQATLLIVAGSGITPIAALLEAHLRRRGASSAKALPALTLVWTVRRAACTSPAPRLHLACTSPAPRLYPRCTAPYSVSPSVHLPCTSAALSPHLRRTSPRLPRCVTSTSF